MVDELPKENFVVHVERAKAHPAIATKRELRLARTALRGASKAGDRKGTKRRCVHRGRTEK